MHVRLVHPLTGARTRVGIGFNWPILGLGFGLWLCWTVLFLAIDGRGGGLRDCSAMGTLWELASKLALLWHFLGLIGPRQCGHRIPGDGSSPAMMGARIAGGLGCGGGPWFLFSRFACLRRRGWRKAHAIMVVSACR